MNFPMQYPLFQFFYWFVNTPGIGGIVVGMLGTGAVLLYGLTLFWVARGSQSAEEEVYLHPTSALHHQDEHE